MPTNRSTGAEVMVCSHSGIPECQANELTEAASTWTHLRDVMPSGKRASLKRTAECCFYKTQNWILFMRMSCGVKVAPCPGWIILAGRRITWRGEGQMTGRGVTGAAGKVVMWCLRPGGRTGTFIILFLLLLFVRLKFFIKKKKFKHVQTSQMSQKAHYQINR